MIDISIFEYNNLLTRLQDFHAIFYNSWKISKPKFSEDIETACVQFDKEGQYLRFLFNPTFWKSLSEYEKIFVICHETLHVILNHGQRFKDSNNRKIANIAMDLSINHSLINRFGFDRNSMELSKDLCWIDKFLDPSIPDDENAETYYYLLQTNDQNTLENNKNFDSHDFLESDMPLDFSEAIKTLNEMISDDDKTSLSNFLKVHDGGMSAYGAGAVFDLNPHKKTKKKKWETVVKTWCLKAYNQKEGENSTWYKQSRRNSSINRNLILPSDEFTFDYNYSENKAKIIFFLDTSGSCISLKERFFQAANSLNKNKFQVELLCFDTEVYKTNLETKTIYGGGGTSFKILESYIKNNYEKYPKLVFVLTDGFGDIIEPEMPQAWHWFIYSEGNFKFTENYIKSFIPKTCNIHNLANFE